MISVSACRSSQPDTAVQPVEEPNSYTTRWGRIGAEARLLSIPVEVGAGLGVWQDLHGEASSANFTDRLRTASVTHCGTAGPAFLEKLVELRRTMLRG
jgi:hypothetical protein